MDRGSGSLLLALRIVVYAVAIVIGSTMVVADPTADVRLLSIAVGIAALLHAVHRGDLRPIEYSILGLYGTVLGIIVITVGATMSGIEIPDVVTADTTLSLLLTGVVLVVYLGYGRWPSGTSGSAG